MIHLSEKAIEHVKKIRTDSGDQNKNLRIQVVGGGCSGFTYELYLDDSPKSDDKEFVFGDLKVFLDPMSMQYMDGTKIDYVQKSSYEAGFHFDNPNVDSSCGCGKSFNVN